MDVCIRDYNTHEWTSSVRTLPPAMRDAYAQYKERPHYYRETPYTDGEYIVYRPDNDPYLPTYIALMADVHSLQHGNHISIAREIHEMMESDGRAIPIIDLADISVFITYPSSAGGGANWVSARSYQAWAYRDFMYDRNRAIKKSYKSRGSAPIMYESNVRILANQIVTISLQDIDSNIIFNIARNANNSVYFERNDAVGSQVRICDNEYARAGYLGFYTRITMDPGIVTTLHVESERGSLPTQQLSIAHLPDPEETDDERQQCILCVRFRINARFSPCEHKVCCSQCYSQLSKNECPVCRAEITRVMNV